MDQKIQIDVIPEVFGEEFSEIVVTLAFAGLYESKNIFTKFVVIQTSENLRTLARLIKETGRFVEVRNNDYHLIDIPWTWVSSRDRVGYVLGNLLSGLYESGIYSYWTKRYQKFVDEAGVYIVRKGILKYKSSDDKMGIGWDKPFSIGQLEMHFALLGIGLALACIARLSEILWFYLHMVKCKRFCQRWYI